MASKAQTKAKASAASEKKEAPKAAIKVTAIANGYYGNKLRTPGEEFFIDKQEDFSEFWMTREDLDGADERFVATGGTDGVVGTTIKPDELSDEEKAALGYSDNDDRSRDFASDPSNNVSPAASSTED